MFIAVTRATGARATRFGNAKTRSLFALALELMIFEGQNVAPMPCGSGLAALCELSNVTNLKIVDGDYCNILQFLQEESNP